MSIDEFFIALAEGWEFICGVIGLLFLAGLLVGGIWGLGMLVLDICQA